MKQVDRDHYSFGSYAHPGRFASYFYQLREIHDANPVSVLEVGVGDAVIGNYIRDNTELKYTSIDVAADVNPDVIGSVLALPFEDKSFDVVCAFEVLEHLPFEKFESSLIEMKRASKKNVIISLPHFGPALKFNFKFPLLREVTLSSKIPT